MGLFPDDFPFNRQRDPSPQPRVAPEREPEPVSETEHEPVYAPAAEPAAAETAPGAVVPEIGATASAPLTIVQVPVPTADEREPEEPPLDPLPAPNPAPVARERRRSPRQGMRARASLKNDTGRGAPVNVEIDNISMLGVRFRSPHPLTIGDRANIRLEVGPLRWATRFRVITCVEEPRNKRFLIGAQFVGNELARGGWNTAAA